MPRKFVVFVMLAIFSGAIGLTWLTRPSAAQATAETAGKGARPAPPALPISQVILFSSGVGYYQREGNVSGNARVELTFPGDDINDLLKSLVLQDRDGGHISTITYDSADPVDKTLKSFALDLTYNPTFGQILNQARGEKIEVSVRPAAGAPVKALIGTIVGMESRREDSTRGEVDLLNLLAAEGMQSIHLAQIQRIRFLNTGLDSEFKRALEVLASAHDTEKKSVSLNFQGEGKRRVRVGYVVEHPIWKTSYRLVLQEKSKPFLQGWAIVENPSDEDWKEVSMALVSGRPISYRMNLYQPLYIPRPLVEPDLFASLRPPLFSGAMNSRGGPQALGGFQFGGGQVNLGAGGGQLGALGGGLGALGGGLGALGGGLGGLGGGTVQGANRNQQIGQLPRYQRPVAGGSGSPQGADAEDDTAGMAFQRGKISYEDLQERIKHQREAKAEAKKLGSDLAAVDPKEGVSALASAEEIGERFKYVIDERVTLLRQKSALLPIINQDVEAARLSVFNAAIHAKFPVLSLRFKNTSGHPLTQGPVTIYERGSYAGDARLLDVQPNEERLIGYALDVGVEIKEENAAASDQLTALKIVKGVLHETKRSQQAKSYLIMNRSKEARELLIEHPVREGWKLVHPEKPAERSREMYRFHMAVAAGNASKLDVIEAHDHSDRLAITSTSEDQVRLYISASVATPTVKQALARAIALHNALSTSQRRLAQRMSELDDIATEQNRLRANLKVVPEASQAYKRYLTKFDSQETEIEKLHADIKQLQTEVRERQATYERFLEELTID